MDENETYSEMARNMRLHGDMRFKQLTLLMAWLTLAAAGVAQFGGRILVDELSVKAIVAVAGMLFAVVF